MKKTLQEEKNRILKLMEQGMVPNTNQTPDTNDLEDAMGEFVLNCLESGMNHEGIKTIIVNMVDDALEANDDNEGGRLFPQDDEEIDEYSKIYDKNMSQGFKNEVKEGNAFIAAANKAKEEGKDTFELGGKTYNVKK